MRSRPQTIEIGGNFLMVTNTQTEELEVLESWPDELYQALKSSEIRHCVYVPDAGHTRLINRMIEDTEIQDTVLTTEEEGIAYLAGAWLGGDRGVLLMQSSGVGNCINTLSLTQCYRFPLLTIITMRGEWAEFNPMQVSMGRATAKSLEIMGVNTYHVDRAEDICEVVAAGAEHAFNGDQSVAILISQRVIGRKIWSR